jgi:hypothetical protein
VRPNYLFVVVRVCVREREIINLKWENTDVFDLSIDITEQQGPCSRVVFRFVLSSIRSLSINKA